MVLGSGRSRPLVLDVNGFQEAMPSGNARFPLSTSTDGTPVAIGTSSTTVHVARGRAQDELYLWAGNMSASDAVLTIGFNNNDFSNITDKYQVTVSAGSGLSLVCPGLPIEGVTIYAISSAANAISLFGFVMRYYPRDGIQSTPSQQSGFDGSQ
mgnify:CR=1 FL=1